MSKNAIWAIIILMSCALIGSVITQFIWIKYQIDLNEIDFNRNVSQCISEIQRDLESHYRKKSFSTDSPLTKSLLSKVNDPIKKKRYSQELSTLLNNNPDELLENIENNFLESLVKKKVAKFMDLDYDYGIYSNKDQAFTIINGYYVASISGSSSSFEDTDSKGLYNTDYKTDLFEDRRYVPGHLALFFPNKTGYLVSEIWPSMLASLLFTLMILFCFSYTIYVILKQKKVSEMKTDFINNMTHEFKTPIATISLATDSITNKMTISDESKIRRFANIIKEENKRMLNQVEKVLQMAKIDKEDFKLNLTKIDLHELIETAARNMRLKLDRRNGSLTTHLKASNCTIEGDQNHISNIIHNLLDNAEKYSDKDPRIKIVTNSTTEGVSMTITDNGIGMSKDALKNIFDKFYRVHTGNRHDVKGFGLGLSYVKALVSAHNGNVDVKSEIGMGSSFTVFLPFKQ